MKRLIFDQFIESGIFGEFQRDDGSQMCCAMEHSYPQADGTFSPKIKPGIHDLVLYSEKFGKPSHHGYDVYVFDSPDDQGHFYEIHIGNVNAESEGCVCTGKQVGNLLNGGKMLMDSRKAFDKFMIEMGGERQQVEVIHNR